ncbi:MAG: succinate dehydrogenase iron-sulfur subunit, partial [Myxococcales bacterium]
MADEILIRIERRDGPGAPARWEEFKVPNRPNANVISVLMEIQRNPVTTDGKRTTPPAWDAACLEEVCGSCTMVINGKVRQACSALIDRLQQPITLTPMKKFPLVRDLAVDRSKMFEALKRVRGWIPIDGTYDLGPGPRQAPEDQEINYVLSTCMTCGCCLEV